MKYEPQRVREAITENTVRQVLDLLGVQKRQSGGPHNWKIAAPYREDANPSVSIARDSGLWNDKANPEEKGDLFALVMRTRHITYEEAVDLVGDLTNTRPKPEPTRYAKPRGELKPERRYPYQDEHGQTLFEVLRFVDEAGQKTFRQRRRDPQQGWLWNLQGVTQVPYKLPEILAAPQEAPIFIVEGEKDANTLWSLGLAATCNAQGAGKWTQDHAKWLSGREIVILPDNDPPGRKHAEQVKASLQGLAASILVVDLPGLPEKGDVTDWLDAGHSAEDLFAQVEQARWRQGPITAPMLADRLLQHLYGDPELPVLTGLPMLDGIMGGFFPQEVVVLAAQPRFGKSGLGTQLGLGLALDGFRVALVSQEMGYQSLAYRLVSMLTGLDNRKIRTPQLLSAQESWLAQAAAQKLRSLPLLIFDRGLTLEEMIAQVLEAHRSRPLDLLIVDYIGRVMHPPLANRREQEVSEVSRRIKTFAQDTGVPVLALAQLNRQAMSSDGPPMLHHLRDSGSVEADADKVLMIDRPNLRAADEALPEMEDPAPVYIRKNRNGPVGVVQMKFQPHTTRFYERAEDLARYEIQLSEEEARGPF